MDSLKAENISGAHVKSISKTGYGPKVHYVD